MEGYVVVDLETTGVIPDLNDKIIEIALVHVSPAGVIENSWTTLVNPKRDLGPQRIHGIKAADVIAAPTFDKIMPWVQALIGNRIIVAHQAPFDMKFLELEFRRHGTELVSPFDALCTLWWSKHLLTGHSRSLEACCAEVDITIENAHTALGDAIATAKLLEHYILQADQVDEYPFGENPWQTLWEKAHTPKFEFTPSSPIPQFTPTLRGEGAVYAGGFISALVSKLNNTPAPEKAETYLSVLDRALLDRQISVRETHLLVKTASDLGLSQEDCQSLNRQYLKDLIVVAWEDNELTDEEQSDIEKVANLLSIPVSEAKTMIEDGWIEAELRQEAKQESFNHFALSKGDMVVLTGTMATPREEWHDLIISLGLKPHNNVTKKVKLVVAADPDSLSGKARKAEEYKIPIVDEESFKKLLKEIQ